MNGDLVLVGVNPSTAQDPVYSNHLFEITYVPKESPTNWALGTYYLWEVRCQLYTVSYEKFETESATINEVMTKFDNAADLSLGINETLERKKIELVDFSESNPFSGL